MLFSLAIKLKALDTLFDGQLNKNLTVRELLKRILGLKQPGISFLRIANVDQTLDGRIFIMDSKLIIGATMNGAPQSGYAALEPLLKIEEGSFAFVAPSDTDSLTVDRSLNMEIKSLLHSYESARQEINTVFDQESLLDRVFNIAELVDAVPTQPQSIEIPMPETNDNYYSLSHIPELQIAPSVASPQKTPRQPAAFQGLRDFISSGAKKPEVTTNKASNPLRDFSQKQFVFGWNLVQSAFLLTIAAICLLLAFACFWKFSVTGRAPAKNVLSPPSKRHSEPIKGHHRRATLRKSEAR